MCCERHRTYVTAGATRPSSRRSRRHVTAPPGVYRTVPRRERLERRSVRNGSVDSASRRGKTDCRFRLHLRGPFVLTDGQTSEVLRVLKLHREIKALRAGRMMFGSARRFGSAWLPSRQRMLRMAAGGACASLVACGVHLKYLQKQYKPLQDPQGPMQGVAAYLRERRLITRLRLVPSAPWRLPCPWGVRWTSTSGSSSSSPRRRRRRSVCSSHRRGRGCCRRRRAGRGRTSCS